MGQQAPLNSSGSWEGASPFLGRQRIRGPVPYLRPTRGAKSQMLFGATLGFWWLGRAGEVGGLAGRDSNVTESPGLRVEGMVPRVKPSNSGLWGPEGQKAVT